MSLDAPNGNEQWGKLDQNQHFLLYNLLIC